MTFQRVLSTSRAVRMTVAIMVMMILMAGGLTTEWFLVKHAINSASAARQVAEVAQRDQYNLCEAGNTARAQQVQLWQYIITLSPPRTPQAQHTLTLFEDYLRTVFAPRNCGQP